MISSKLISNYLERAKEPNYRQNQAFGDSKSRCRLRPKMSERETHTDYSILAYKCNICLYFITLRALKLKENITLC